MPSGITNDPISDARLREDYPALFTHTRWGGVILTGFHLHAGWPPIEAVQSVNVVPFVGDRCVVVSDGDGGLMFPGGTRELGESLEETARREIMEETGSVFKTCTPFAYWECHSDDARAWRPFLAHPDFTRAIAWADVEIIGPPSNPDDGEQIANVDLMTVEDAVARFLARNRPELADIYRLAAFVRSESRGTHGVAHDQLG